MPAQVEHNQHQQPPQQQQRPLHLNMSTPLHSRTLDTIQCEITKDMIAAIAMHARSVIPCTPAPALTSSDRTSPANAASGATDTASLQRSTRSGLAEKLPSPPATPGANTLSNIPPLDIFITNLVLRSRVQAGTLICTFVYLQRLRHRLPKEARGMECTCHRIFLATLIVAGKYLNDASPKNKYWARYSTMFTVAEVNLMEKQLLFLLDFDLRIDNGDLNEAASAFHPSNAKYATPLTPTTPPFGALHSHRTASESAAVASSALAQSRSGDANMAHSIPAIYESRQHHHPVQKGGCPGVYPEPSRVYPPTLGLGNNSIATNHVPVQSQQKPQHTRLKDRHMSHQPLSSALEPSSLAGAAELTNGSGNNFPAMVYDGAASMSTAQSHDRRHYTDTTRPQFSFNPKPTPQVMDQNMRSGSISASSCESIQHQGCSYYSGVGSHNGLPHLPSAGPLHQLSAGEQLQLRPSPKKRAVSRGNCGNVPHPSPVYYHCPDSGIASSAATAAPSAATSSSAHFLQPLEQVQSSYARSRYQQQRYDPCASRSVSSKSMAPRMSVSIPSLRKSTHSNSPELEKSSGSSTLSRKGQKGRYILRHQSTAPDIAKVGSMVSGLSSNQFSASLVPFSKDRSTSGIRGGQPHCKPSANSAETPARPLPARLASYGSSAMDASPVNTLVFSESPAASLSLTAPEGYAHSLSAQGSHSYSTQMDIGDSNTRTLTAPPITALSELSVGTKMNTSGNSLHHQYHDSGAHLCSEVGNHFADGANDDCDAVNTSGNSSGWQLRSKILNPLSAWFRLSRHPHPQQSIGNKQHNHTVQHFHSSNGNPSSSNCQPKAHVGGNGVSSTDKRQASKGASAPSVASKRLRDRGVGTCSLSPLYLEPPVAAVPARGNN